jgi:Sigma-70 region 2
MSIRHAPVPESDADRTAALIGDNSVPSDCTPVLAATAVEVLFREHHGKLVRLAVLMVGDQQTAEDVVQDVFARMHVRWSQVTAQDAPLSYVRGRSTGRAGTPAGL